VAVSTTQTRRTYREALEDAQALRARFDGLYLRWEIAGSVRRRAREVGDVEHVVIAREGSPPNAAPQGTLFEPARVNLLWHRLDALRLNPHSEIRQHLYGAAQVPRWGSLVRGVDFRNFNHEIFSAQPGNWGSTLAIRTGPAEYSRRLVTMLRKHGRRNVDGWVWECVPCPQAAESGRRCGEACEECQGTQLKPLHRVDAFEESDYFRLCGMNWIRPEQRT
jgi:hypothetical protein